MSAFASDVVRMIVGIVFRLGILLDVSQDLAAVHFGEVQIQQDKIGARGIGLGPLATQKGHGLDAVERNMQMDRRAGFAKGFLRQPDVARTVFDQENLDPHAIARTPS